MAWEKRGEKKYYYRKSWVNGRCVSEYIGAGMVAPLIEQQDRWEKKKTKIARQEMRRLQRRDAALDAQLDEFSRINRNLVDALFLINGYHLHKRQWRKKRVKK
ncbi:MAG TPA: hypothetical protein VF721_07535 [Pyrinomonadaceae bacterium]|jgi:hypothetical protein